MSALGNCEAGVCRSIKLLFKLLLKDAFLTRFGFSGPKHVTHIRDLAFIPYVLKINVRWRRVNIERIRHSLRLEERQWARCLISALSLDRNSVRLKEIGQALV